GMLEAARVGARNETVSRRRRGRCVIGGDRDAHDIGRIALDRHVRAIAAQHHRCGEARSAQEHGSQAYDAACGPDRAANLVQATPSNAVDVRHRWCGERSIGAPPLRLQISLSFGGIRRFVYCPEAQRFRARFSASAITPLPCGSLLRCDGRDAGRDCGRPRSRSPTLWRAPSGRARGELSPSLMVSATRRRCRSTSSTFTLTTAPALTTSRGSFTKRSDIMEMCTRPSWCTPTSTKAPKLVTFVTTPSSTMP